MSDPADIQRLLGDMIRFGRIASVDLDKRVCTVAIGPLTTGAVPWITGRAGGTVAWSPPTVGEQCLLLCPEGDTAAGVALLGLYSNTYPAPVDGAGLHYVRHADGAEIAYDAEAHRLAAILPTGGKAEITAPGGIELHADVTIIGKLDVQGDAAIAGKVAADGDVTAGTISLQHHTHPGVQSGPAKTLAPLP